MGSADNPGLNFGPDRAWFSSPAQTHAEGDELTQRVSKWALSLATVFACLAFPGTAAAFGPEPAHAVEASSVPAPPPAPEPPPVVQAEPVSASAVQPEVDETVVAEEYQSAIKAPPTPVDPPEAAPAPASELAESSRQLGEPHEPIAPKTARNHDAGDPQRSELKLVRRVLLEGSMRGSADRTAGRWQRHENLQYQAAISNAHVSDISPEKISSRLSSSSSASERRDVRRILIQIRVKIVTDERQHYLSRTARTRDEPNHCDERDFRQAARTFGKAAAWKAGKVTDSQQSHLVEMVLKAKGSETIEAVGTGLRSRVQNAGLLDCAEAHTLSSSRGRTPPSPMLQGESGTRRFTSLPSADRGAELKFGRDITARTATAKVLRRSKASDTTIVGPLSRVLRAPLARPSPEVADGLTDTRRLVQIGLVLGMAYVAFLTFWFWGTRARGRRPGSGREW